MQKPAVGIYLDHRQIQVGRIQDNKILDQHVLGISKNLNGDHIVHKLHEAVDLVFSKGLSCIGLGVHGKIDTEKGLLLDLYGRTSTNSFPLKSNLESHYKLPVFLSNDAACFTLLEKYFGRAKKCKDIIGLVINSEMSTGMITENRMCSGINGKGGNIAGLPYLKKDYGYYCSENFFQSEHHRTFRQVLEQAAKKDKKALAILAEFGQHVGNAITLLIQVFNPQMLFIGGSAVKASNFFGPAMNETIQSHFKNSRPTTKIVFEKRDEIRLALLGAAALQDIFKEKSELKKEIQKRKKIEKTLADKNIILNAFLDNIPDYMYVKDVNSRFIMNNKSHMYALGAESQDEVVGKSDFDFFPEELARLYNDDEQAIIKSGKILIDREEKAINKTTGKKEWLSSTKVPIYDQTGDKFGIVGITRDITERKNADLALVKSKNRLQIAKKETDNILQNVEEGLLLVMSDFKIGTQYSTSLESIFQQRNLAKISILDLLKNKISDHEIESFKEYLELILDPSVNETALSDLNPLNQIKLVFNRGDGDAPLEKYLSFRFQRIKSGRALQLISTVKDVTKEVHLAEKLQKSEAQKKMQMELMFNIMHVEPELLHEFMDGTEAEIASIETLLKSTRQQDDYHTLLPKMYRSMHTIKGNASLLDLKFIAEKAHEFEEELEKIKAQSNISSTDFIGLVFKLDAIQNLLGEIKRLINQFGQIQKLFRPQSNQKNNVLITSLDNFVRRTSQELKKKIRLSHTNFKSEDIPYRYRILIKEVLIQLIRNAIFHGIESPAERRKAGKKQQGKIEISTKVLKNKLFLKIYDDGQGIRTDKLKVAALKSGKWKKQDLDKWEKEKLAALVFCQGITTAQKSNLVAGRGVGMDVIKQKIIKNQGTISLHFEETRFSEFRIEIPLF